MSENLQAALIGALVGGTFAVLGGLLTSFLNNRYAENRRKAEDRKWYAEHFLSRKIDALSKLYSSLVVADSAVTESVGLMIEEPEKLSQHLGKLENAIERFKADRGLSWVYMDGDERKSINDVDWEFSYVLEIVLNYSPQKVAEHLDYSRVTDSYDSAQATMEKLLSPDILKGIEPKD